jgi:hypothetical protein
MPEKKTIHLLTVQEKKAYFYCLQDLQLSNISGFHGCFGSCFCVMAPCRCKLQALKAEAIKKLRPHNNSAMHIITEISKYFSTDTHCQKYFFHCQVNEGIIIIIIIGAKCNRLAIHQCELN